MVVRISISVANMVFLSCLNDSDVDLLLSFFFFRVKGDQMKLSLDYLQSNDFEMATNVLGGIDLVKDLFVFSDKCTGRELQKTYDEFAKDLKKLRGKTRVSVWKYIKDVDAGGKGETENSEDVASPTESTNYENVVS